MSGRIELTDELCRSLLEPVIGIAREAGRKAAAHQPRAGQTVEAKGDGSPVTVADRAAHEHIMAALNELELDLPVVSEEGSMEGVESGRLEQFWLVDPLDGTKDFIAGRAEYTVNIALVEDGNPVLGVVVAPADGRCWFACRGAGAAKRDGEDADEHPIHCGRSLVDNQPRAVISRSHSSESTRNFLARIGAGEVLRSGSSIKICLVAEDAADIYPRMGPTSLWDTAAGVAVAREAGCRVVDLHGRELTFDPADGILHRGFIVAVPELVDRAVAAVD